MKLQKPDLTQFKKLIPTILLLLGFSIAAELIIFNFRSLTTLGNTPMQMLSNIDLQGPADYESFHATVNTSVDNVLIRGLRIESASAISAHVELSDEGNVYPYPLPEFRIVPGVPQSGYADIYAYGKVHDLCIFFHIPEGAAVHIDEVYFNVHKPFSIKPLRLLLLFLVFSFITASWSGIHTTDCKRRSLPQIVCIVLSVCFLIVLGRNLSRSNEKLMNDPPSHHAQYQELALALEEGHVSLDNIYVAPELLEKANPYDTLALMAENIPFSMDYAYRDGHYYVYFGIIPELLFYYPWYRIHDELPDNASAQWRFYALFVIGIFLLLWEMVQRYRKGHFPLWLYLSMSWACCLYANFVFLVSRPDIYNIPVMAANGFTALGLGLWLAAANRSGWLRMPLLFGGSFCMACVAGCRPQMLLFSVCALFWFFFSENQQSGRLSFTDRTLLRRGSIGESICFILPYLLVAVPVCWYNHARFGSIFEFGATFSLTTNDMNLRGFNMDRLLRGLYCFLFQPRATSPEFPWLTVSNVDSAYMGRNLVEFTFGGALSACPLILVVIFPFFKLWKKLSHERRALWISLLLSSLVIAAFDVNGAGILYRYSCDFALGFLLCAMLLWIQLLSDPGSAGISKKIFSVLLLQALFYSLQVFCADGDYLFLKESSPVLYEKIHSYFM